ncbi:FeoA family protein [Geoalkalibacter sp.]|uniref:FeoA family protein n=1 Tax=Geoalkalibacter sp. TaxID=3041440 RepID=UPI00272EAB87|nr:FeoA family protein [Geoalkalibacter sp.]
MNLNMMPLGLLAPGEKALIAEVRTRPGATARETDDESAGRLEELGLRIGKEVEMLSRGSGPLLLRVDESRIALARGLAMNIWVWR